MSLDEHNKSEWTEVLFDIQYSICNSLLQVAHNAVALAQSKRNNYYLQIGTSKCHPKINFIKTTRHLSNLNDRIQSNFRNPTSLETHHKTLCNQ